MTQIQNTPALPGGLGAMPSAPAGRKDGGSADFSWTFKGSVSRLTSLRVVLEGSEEARYRRGTSTYTDRDVFASAEFLYLQDGGIAGHFLRLCQTELDGEDAKS